MKRPVRNHATGAADAIIKVAARAIAVSEPNQLLYPSAKFRKIDVVNYYVRVARYLLPHFRNRPVTLKRYPDGIHGEVFYEKDAPGFTPSWVKTFPVPRREGGPDIRYVLINDKASLAWAASMACLELHPFLHRVPMLERPSFVVFDLDPGEGADIHQCVEVALILRDVLTKLRLRSFAKVSGSKGIQVYVPLNSPVAYGVTQPFAHAIAELLEHQQPKLIVSDMPKNLRHGKIFIDWSQNADHKTTVGVYSLRAKRHRPYVSMPVTWQELESAWRKNEMERLYFTADAALLRLTKIGDLFAPVLKLSQKLPAEFVRLSRDGTRKQRAGSKSPAVDHAIATKQKSQSERARSIVKTLAEYQGKRHFDITTEPLAQMPRRSAQGSRRRFVVQKHAASHLHYDFRLEMHDVLKSWAVPKGLPLENGQRHTAIETEDHPIEYIDFEGVIPQGEYGGGTVMVWDIGTYELVAGNYWKGELSVFLSGKKLKGEWTLSRIPSEDEKTKWLMTKTGGAARPIPRQRESVSALSGNTMDQIAGERAAVWRSNRGESDKRSTLKRIRDHASNAAARAIEDRVPPRPRSGSRKSSTLQSTSPPGSSRNFRKGVGSQSRRGHVKQPAKQERLQFIQPMKATAVASLPEGDEWIYEVKWDGYRALALKRGDEVRLVSLKEKNLTTDFPMIVEAVRTVNADTAILDGEIVAVDAQGCPSFQMLQNRASMGREWQIVYYAFDLLNREGKPLHNLPLFERKTQLQEVVGGSDVRYNADLAGGVSVVLRSVDAAGLEGVVAKRRDSLYRAGTRVTTWLKLKLTKAQEFVIGGYKPDGGSFQSILVGYYEGKKLIFAGKVRQGFNPPARGRLLKQMRPFLARRCPFNNLPTSKRSHFGEGITSEEMAMLCWLRPRLIAQVSFTEWTNYGLLRHATFEGLRDDKDPRAIVREPG